MRIAIVGQGPKGIYALSELLQHWPAGQQLEVHTFDPRPVGDGSAYGPEQGRHMRLNVRPPVLELPPLAPFEQWLADEGIDPQSEELPRSAVGRYLSRARRAMVENLPDGVSVVHHSCQVDRATRVEQGWLVQDGEPLLVDELLLATGHAHDHDDQLVNVWDPDQHTRLVPRVYPVQEWLDEEHVPAGCTVAIRGAGLTFIDVAMELVEGREPSRRPARILPISRSGTLMHSRPMPGEELHPDDHATILSFADAMPDDPRGIIETVSTVAAQLLVDNGYPADEAARMVEHTVRTGWEEDLVDNPQRALAAVNRSIAVAEAAARAGAAWMLGRTWAILYPTVVRRLAFTEPDPETWLWFGRRTQILDRFAFGPGLGNAIRIADMCERLVIDPSWLAVGITLSDRIHGLPEGEEQPDVLIDAVPSPPGAGAARTPLIDLLLAEGFMSLPKGRRGVRTTPSAQCLGSDDSPTPGLSVVGRPVDDTVMGNDTLNQATHDQIPQWVARIVRTTLDKG